MFDASDNFIGAEFWVMNKSQMIAGSSPDYVDFGPYSDYFSIYPVSNLQPTSTQYMVSVDPGVTGSFVLFSIAGHTSGTVSVTNVTYSIKSSGPTLAGIQPGTTARIDTGDGRILSAIWYNSKLWFAFDDSSVPTGDTRSRSSFRLVQLDTNSKIVLQDFEVNSAGVYYFYPALTFDDSGNLLVLFGFSSTSDYPGLMVTAQTTSDPPNTYQTPRIVFAGTGPEKSGRYGDYFGAAVDPSNPLTVWAAGQYGTANGWATRIISASVTNTIGEAARC